MMESECPSLTHIVLRTMASASHKPHRQRNKEFHDVRQHKPHAYVTENINILAPNYVRKFNMNHDLPPYIPARTPYANKFLA